MVTDGEPTVAAPGLELVDERAAAVPTRLSWMTSDGRALVGHVELALRRDIETGRISRVAIAPEQPAPGGERWRPAVMALERPRVTD